MLRMGDSASRPTFCSMPSDDPKIYYKRHLPHYQLSNVTYFVTIRLAGSLPRQVIQKLQEEALYIEKKLKSISNLNEMERQRLEFAEQQSQKFNDLLDSSKVGQFWLGENKIAKAVAEAIHHRHNKDYDLICFSIMPNHLHLIFGTISDIRTSTNHDAPVFPLQIILESLKKFSARECNKLLNRTGAFWQHESYDHIIRSQKELDDSILYVLNNPVKIGLVSNWQDWRWNYLNPKITL
jgi:REP element-mobilizing transposase RayT